MKKKGISQYSLINRYHISPGQITRLKRNKSVSKHAIETFCRILNCRAGKITEYAENPLLRAVQVFPGSIPCF